MAKGRLKGRPSCQITPTATPAFSRSSTDSLTVTLTSMPTWPHWDWKAAASLVRTLAANYKLPYYTISPTYSICKDHGYIVGEHYTCPTCGGYAEVYSRITGYYRPVQNWNVGKSAEFKDRKLYNVRDALECDMSGHGHAAAGCGCENASAFVRGFHGASGRSFSVGRASLYSWG